MAQDRVFVGVDVSKDRLDVHVHGEAFAVENDKAGLKRLVGWLKALGPKTLGPVAVGLEASGGYERSVLLALAEAGLEVYRLDPAQVRAFARGVGLRAKTDALDAQVIARCLQAVIDDIQPYRPDPSAERLAALAGFRRKLVGEITGLKSYADRMAEPLVKRMVKTRLAALKLAVARLDKEIRTQIAADATAAHRFELYTSARGSARSWPPP